MKIAIILVNYNKAEYTLACLSSLNKIESDSFGIKVFVVDNNSSQKIKINNKDYPKIEVELIESNENLGFSGGNNLAIKKALTQGFDYFLILNNDTTQSPDFLVNLIRASEKFDPGIISPKIYFSKGHEYHKDKYNKEDLGKVIWYAGGAFDYKNILASHRGVDEVDDGQFNKTEETDFATGCCMLIKRKVFEKIGLFNEKYFLYLEDLELSFRAKKNGFKIFYNPDSVIWHINAGSTGGSGSDLQDYFISRNRMLFGLTYMKLRIKLVLIKESFKLLLTGRKFQKIGIKDFYLRKFGKGSMSL